VDGLKITSDEALRAKLAEAYEAEQDKHKMGRLRMQIDMILQMQKGGMSREKILAVLNEGGLQLTMETFNGYLYLLKREREGKKYVRPKKKSKPAGELKTKSKSTEVESRDKLVAISSSDQVGVGEGKRPAPVLRDDRQDNVWNKLKPPPVGGLVDLDQK